MKTRLLPLLVVALYIGAPAASAQEASPPATAATQPPQPRLALYTGIQIAGTAQMNPDGTVTPTSYLTVRNVAPGSPADSAGVEVGDIIIEINGQDTRTPSAVALRPGAPNTYRLRRGEMEFEVVITTRTRPGAPPPQR